MTKVRVTVADQKKARELMDHIKPIPGEMRTVSKCVECGKLHGRRFIPYGIGIGLTFNPCHCILVSNARSITLLSKRGREEGTE